MADLFGSVLSLNAADRPTMAAVVKALNNNATWYATGERGELEFFGLKELQAVDVIIQVPTVSKTQEFDNTSSTSSSLSLHDMIRPFKQIFSAIKTTTTTKTNTKTSSKQQHQNGADRQLHIQHQINAECY